ncbi:aldolase [Pararhizobium polonicum]|jgi:4-hydroxy-2-oxoheptanedioate aldolase|uniref:Aldolase n=1 Tax=Pararhizobium polonicum TaxID=1612624 RepID=A0A1C7P172_9HYPH|nr:aldolase/citrate lyase family protein [Pararhizobium polonicum]OBZ93424.1 aldolase [Pararhizobium polonicum]
MTRLNGVIGALEQGQRAFGTFAPADMESALWVSSAGYDGVIYEMEHRPWDAALLRDTLQYMLNRKQILSIGSPAPGVTPIVRIPANGGEMNQWMAKQALDMGAFGVVWPHVSTAEQAYNAVAACRYPRRNTAPIFEPSGIRGDSPGTAARFWGIDTKEYYRRADVWPLAPEGEILVILMIEDLQGIANLDEMLTKVPGIGAVLIGEGDLSQELGHPREYEHPEVIEAMAEIVRTCKARGIPVGHPHVGSKNVERVIEEGYSILLASPVRTFAALEAGKKLAGRA